MAFKRNADALVRNRRFLRRELFVLRTHCGRGRPRSIIADNVPLMCRERSYKCGRYAKYLDLMLCAEFPHAVGRRVIGSTIIYADSCAIDQSTVDQPRPHHPADVRVPRDPRAFANIRAKRHVLCRLDRKTRVGVSDALWLARCAGGVEDDKWVF